MYLETGISFDRLGWGAQGCSMVEREDFYACEPPYRAYYESYERLLLYVVPLPLNFLARAYNYYLGWVLKI